MAGELDSLGLLRRLRATSTLLLDAVERDDVDSIERAASDFGSLLDLVDPSSLTEESAELHADLLSTHATILGRIESMIVETRNSLGAVRTARHRLRAIRNEGPMPSEVLDESS